MEITIFKEVTTEGVINSIEENSKKYHDGLYADMNNLPERTMVKKGAAEIGDIIKQLKTSRIAITKSNTAAVNKEHDAIVERLQVANKPFTDLLDAYNIERKKILDAEKSSQATIALRAKIEDDHEMALLMNKTFAYDRDEAARVRAEEIKEIEATQLALAVEQQERLAVAKRQDEKNAENARLANKEHVRRINSTALHGFMAECDFTYDQAKAAVTALAQNKILNTTINY